MVRPELDWKNQPRNILDWVSILVAGVLIVGYLYQWSMTDQSPYSLIAMVFFAWLAVFLTDYWQPILYLVMAVLVVMILVFGFFEGLVDRPVGQLTFLLTGGFLLVIVYLFFSEEADQEKVESAT